MRRFSGILILFLSSLLGIYASGQRTYKTNSVLSSGNWYKISVNGPGIYKVDLPFLNSLGVNANNIPSASIRLFGNGGQMLSEANSSIQIDDLEENAISVVDGGDGIFNGADYFLFYAPGPDRWVRDSVNKVFRHQKNIYSDSAYYFISIGGSGKRISSLNLTATPAATVNSYDERIFHELDSVNLLSSGKEWLGEEFADAPGKTLARTFSISVPNLIASQPLTIISDCVARSINVASRVDLRISNQLVQQISIPSTGPGFYDLFARQSKVETSTSVSTGNIQLNYSYVPGGFNSQAWLNFFEIHARCSLSFPVSGRLFFQDWTSVGNNVAEFVISNVSAGTSVWEVSDPLNPVAMQGNFSGSEFRFRNDASRIREYVAFNSSGFLPPVKVGQVTNQNLHNIQPTDYLVIANPLLLSEATRLANYHRQKNNLKVTVVSTEQVFNEFSSGSPDPTAIRDFVKMYFDEFSGSPSDRPKYLLLFGDASFDYKNRIKENTNLVPAYQSQVFLDPLSSYTSDDFFGFLDDNENINSDLVVNLLDIGIGRIPAKNINEAKNYIDKVISYHDKNSFGPWRNIISFVADDEDNNIHIQDAELISQTSSTANMIPDIQKIYLDAYPQQSSSAGGRYPAVNEAINNRILNGTLIFNFIGHGGASRLAEEDVLDQPMINTWNNSNKLPLFVTATCDFAPYDNPFVNSLGENLLIRPGSGAIALMTTTRLVFSFSNRIMNNNYMQFALQPVANGKYRSLGEAVMAAKNYTYQTSSDLINNRKFTLLGDPALTLGFPQLKISTTKINGLDPTVITDTLAAGEKVIVEGEITDFSGSVLTDFNGTVYQVLYDKPQTINTLGNDATSFPVGFQQQLNSLFKGKSTVANGRFSFEFKMPKDINYQYGNGKLSYYAVNGVIEGSDYLSSFIIGGSSGASDPDREGPLVKAWLNDEKFVNGSIVNQNPILVLELADSSGINTTGNGIGHDITAMLDNDPDKIFVLNDYFEADLDKYGSGKLRFQLPEQEPGPHHLKIKAWDVLNNSSEYILDFMVVNDEDLVIDHVLNYPNPFTTKTQFWFEHNKPGQELLVQIHIYSLAGKVVKTIEKAINSAGNRSCELEWDGRDEFGDKVARGVYLYRLRVRSLGSKTRTFYEKMVVL